MRTKSAARKRPQMESSDSNQSRSDNVQCNTFADREPAAFTVLDTSTRRKKPRNTRNSNIPTNITSSSMAHNLNVLESAALVIPAKVKRPMSKIGRDTLLKGPLVRQKRQHSDSIGDVTVQADNIPKRHCKRSILPSANAPSFSDLGLSNKGNILPLKRKKKDIAFIQSSEPNRNKTTRKITSAVIARHHTGSVMENAQRDNQAEMEDDNDTAQLHPGRTGKHGKGLLETLADTGDLLKRVPPCKYCSALKFAHETANFCCSAGDITLANNKLPSFLIELLTTISEENTTFKDSIRTYNNHLAFTSFGVKYDKSLAKKNKGIYTFRIQGQVYHFIDNLQHNESSCKNLQFYFHDTEYEIANRLQFCPRLSETLLPKILRILEENPYTRFFKSLRNTPDLDKSHIILYSHPTIDQKVYNRPTTSEVAALWVDGEIDEETIRRNIHVYLHGGEPRPIQYYYGCYDALQYPLMFPYGELGWHQGIVKNATAKRRCRQKARCNNSNPLSLPQNASDADAYLEIERQGVILNERTYYNILDITPHLPQWTVRVQVIQRDPLQLSRPDRNPPGNTYRRHVVTDEQGTKVSVVAYQDDIYHFNSRLLPYKRYVISSASLRPARGGFKVSSYNYTWVIEKRNIVDEIHEPVPPSLPCTFETTRFRDIYKFADKQAALNVKGVIADRLGTRDMSDTTWVTDFIIVNEEKIPMVLTLWSSIEDAEPTELFDRAHDEPTVIALTVKATTFFGLSLSSKMATYILVDPPVADGQELRNWYDNNRQDVRRLIAAKSYDGSDILIPRPHPRDVMPVSTVARSIEMDKTMWIFGEMTLQQGQRSLWFPACSSCWKTVIGDTGWIFTCSYCKNEARIEARCRFTVFVRDSTGVVQVVLSSPEAEKFLPFAAIELRYAGLTGYPSYQHVAEKIKGQRGVFFLKYFPSKYQGDFTKKYTVVKAYPYNEAAENSDPFDYSLAAATEAPTTSSRAQPEFAPFEIIINNPESSTTATTAESQTTKQRKRPGPTEHSSSTSKNSKNRHHSSSSSGKQQSSNSPAEKTEKLKQS